MFLKYTALKRPILFATNGSEFENQNPRSILNFLFQERKKTEGGNQEGAASRKDNIDTRSPAIAFSLNASGEHKSDSASERTGLKFSRCRQDDGRLRPQGRDRTYQLSDSNRIVRIIISNTRSALFIRFSPFKRQV